MVYDRRYIWGVSLGVLIANLQSSLGIIDITWGTLTTLITLSVVIIAIRKLTDNRVKLALTVIITTILMGFLVALELTYILKVPFFYTWGTVSLGEFGVMFIGAFVMYALGKSIDLSLNKRS